MPIPSHNTVLVDLANGTNDVPVFRYPVTVIQVVEGNPSFTLQGAVLAANEGQHFSDLAWVNMRTWVAHPESEGPSLQQGDIIGVVTGGIQTLRVAGGSSGKLGVSALDIDAGPIASAIASLSSDNLSGLLASIRTNQDELLAWLIEARTLFLQLLDGKVG